MKSADEDIKLQVQTPTVNQISVHEPARLPMSTNSTNPDMAALRAICSGKIDPKTGVPELTVAGLEVVSVEPAPVCMACECSMVEGRGKLAGRWACQDVSCPRYGLEVRR